MAIKKIYVDQTVADDVQTLSICKSLNLPAETVASAHDVFAAVAAAPDPVQRGKEVLFLTRNKGAFVKLCPGTRHYTCCDYAILHIGTFCNMDCAYCIMQSYFHPPVLQYFVNHGDLLSELDRLFACRRICRIGTGEFTDSLIWENWTGLSQILVPRFAAQDTVVLELKSKTTAIENFKAFEHQRKTILSWSLNTPRVISRQERSTASLTARLQAAARCESWGYPLAFHFDPMLIYEGCEADYRAVVEQLFTCVSPDNVVWISLGTFRFPTALKTVIEERFPESDIIYGEFIPGLDGKMRYFKPMRIALYRKMAAWIREFAPHATLYFCMEDDEVWQKSLGFLPADRGGLPRMLDESAVRHCGLDPQALHGEAGMRSRKKDELR
ncbi:MAG: spore photoproduct lyase family protein [Desulfobacterales bacterium]|jgi:spore photoproduct lyase